MIRTAIRLSPFGRIIGVLAVVALPLVGCASMTSGHPSAPRGSATVGSAASAAAEPGITNFVCPGAADSVLLQWTDTHGQLTGTFEQSSLSGQPPQQAVSSNSGALAGTLNGAAITLSIGLSQPLYGTLNGSTLTLNVPQQDGSFQAGTCTEGSLADWNKAVAALNAEASRDNSQTEQEQQQAQREQDIANAQDALAKDVSALNNDASTLNNDKSLGSDITTMKHDYATEQADFKTEQSDSCDSMSVDADGVGTDADGVGTDLDGLNTDIQALQNNAIQSVQNDLASVHADLAQLRTLATSPATNTSTATAAGNQALKSAAAAINWAQGQGNTINNAAQQLATTAQNYAQSHC